MPVHCVVRAVRSAPESGELDVRGHVTGCQCSVFDSQHLFHTAKRETAQTRILFNWRHPHCATAACLIVSVLLVQVLRVLSIESIERVDFGKPHTRIAS